MSWEDVDQGRVRGAPSSAACTLTLRARNGKHIRMWCTIDLATREKLGWATGAQLTLQMGRGPQAGQVRIVPGPSGRQLKRLPRSTFTSIELAVPEDLAQWEGGRMEVEHQVNKGGILVCRLPWDLPMDAEGYVLPVPRDDLADTAAEAEAA